MRWRGRSATRAGAKTRSGVIHALVLLFAAVEVRDLPEHGFDLEIRGSGFAPFRQSGFQISGARESFELGSFRLKPGATVEIRVTDPRGRPLPGAAVWLEGAGSASPLGESGLDGRFAIRDLDPSRSSLPAPGAGEQP